ncbi:HNH endonuclease [Saccharibacillus kuerlensis]|uniref:HNH nuclease domain-containing protein n=1 Tax=Saccharibacillus kuerlensis TaxID=459527 RepID=A0ABQ2KS82_9BACL|nr:HNH endonuclease [Saccharibacillus kuerlensis]GGN91493.1 hypothetical protein GCM10010969_03230 [Saccharibacillus kuerlensis]
MVSNKYFTKDILREANNAAIREKRNKAIKKEAIEELGEEDVFPIIFKIYHNTTDEIRVMIRIGEFSPLLDMSQLRYDSLPTFISNKNGELILEEEESFLARRPYPNKREWQEVSILKPLRRQNPFRNKILELYNNQCAICNITNSTVLRAAHIWPVSDGGKEEVQNGICLCVIHEVAYDANLFEITDEGYIILNTDDDLKIDYFKIRPPLEKDAYPSAFNIIKRKEYFDKKKK